MFSLKSKLTLFVLSLLIIVSLNACNSSASSSTSGTFPVDPTFLDFYREFGGVSNLGPAISPPFVKQNITYQYVVTGLMVYNPNQTTLTRFYFSPSASIEWNINDLIEPAPSDPNQPYVNGHRIWEEVLSFYNRYGSEIIGLPVTSVRANDAEQQYEQYFDGIGFFRKYSDPPGQIQLMPYGYWMCGNTCQYLGPDSAPPSASYSRDFSETEQLFLQESERLGFGFTGAPLASPYMAADGNFEMVFENVALFIDPSDDFQIKLRPLPSWLGIQADEPTMETKADWLAFYPIGEGLGYNVPKLFITYIEEHGNMAYSGYPINEYRLQSDDGYFQCYTHICLEYHPTAPELLRIRLHELGTEFMTNGTSTNVGASTLVDALQINVWEQYPLIPSGHRQVINIEASQNDAPVSGIEFSLVVKRPDGITKTYNLTPTGEGGMTSIELDPINGPNSAIIQYEVCVLGAVTPQVCFTRRYSIWEE